MNRIVDLTGKHILVIGASSGIGKETSIILSRLGARLDLAARSVDNLNETKTLLEGQGHQVKQFDVTKLDKVDKMIEDLTDEFGAYDGLVYSAGVATSRPLHLFSAEIMKWVFDVNYFGFVEVVRQISKRGRFNPGMRIVGVSSVAAFRGDAAHTGYSGSKAAMNGAIKSMAVELAKKSICINTVAPGLTNTQMYDDYVKYYGTDDLNYEILRQRQYLGIAEPEDIANAIAFLLSSGARMITGICVPVDGGFTN